MHRSGLWRSALGRWCTSCSRNTHNTDQCWGICKHCGGKGHQAEKCRFKKDAETKAEADVKAKKAEANKKKKLKKQIMKKKKKEGGANKATVDLPGAGAAAGGDTSSSSDEPSPYFDTGARGKRVAFSGLGAVKKATAFCYPSLGDIHEDIEDMTEEQIREQIHKAYVAKNSEASPVMQGIVSKHKNGQGGSPEILIADTGCSFPNC